MRTTEFSLRPGPVLVFSLLIFAGTMLPVNRSAAQEQRMYIASPAKPAVIYLSALDLKTGEFREMKPVAEVSTGFMALHPKLPILYAASREQAAKGEPNGGVRAYRIQDDGSLKEINRVSTNDNGTTHIEVSRDGRNVLVCHYGGAGTTAIALKSDGSLGENQSQIAHKGSSADPKRQTRPHPHGIAIDGAGRFAAVADLGNDHVEVFELTGPGEMREHGFWKAAPGAGPRHVTFHPNGKWLYCINELDSTMDVLDFDASAGTLTSKQTINTLPEKFEGQNSTAEVVVHPSGRFVYGSNRGHNSTVVFSVNPNDGKLTPVQHEPTRGDHPRFVGLTPDGAMYVAANTFANTVFSFHVDSKTGKLKATGSKLEVDRPMCVVFPR